MLDTTEVNEIPSTDLGTFLKDERLSQGKTLDDVENVTGISAKILQGIEDNDHNRLPNYIFVRGLVRIYSNFLKLDQNIVLELFEKEWVDEIKDQKAHYLKRPGLLLASSSSSTGCFAVVILIILAILAVIVMINRQRFNPPSSINKHVIQEPATRYTPRSLTPSGSANSPNKSTQRPSAKVLSDYK